MLISVYRAPMQDGVSVSFTDAAPEASSVANAIVNLSREDAESLARQLTARLPRADAPTIYRAGHIPVVRLTSGQWMRLEDFVTGKSNVESLSFIEAASGVGRDDFVALGVSQPLA